ncbi:hypothetical protein [Armatimonas sp.]|uniref:hypothetical protein n=1 Tax=Armatimonas sp. TaxID=1872638 RepID=UPI00286D1F4F|nr:hypothetical protein [Armatimonas sp.]
MKQELPKGIIVAVIALLVIVVGVVLGRQLTKPDIERDAQGNLVTGLDPSKMERDPVKFKAAMDKLIQDEKAAKGGR